MYTEYPILVVDDVPAMREIIVRQLRSRKFENVYSASNAGAAFRMLESQPFRLVLADWHMPDMNGVEFVTKMRAHPRLRHISFILMTSDLPRGNLEVAVQAGIDEFMLKPFTPAVLEEKINNALAGQRFAAPPKVDETLLPGEEPVAEVSEQEVPTILVVDDMPANLTLASSVLRHDYQVKLAISGAKALALCAAAPPDLILLDIMMPDMDGFAMCRALKDNPLTAHIPVIFLTALEDTSNVVAGLQLGAVDYVSKPMEPVILKARVANALRIARAQEELRQQYDLIVENVRLREEVENMNRHDIKNPLAAIQAMSDNLLNDTEQTADGKRMLRFIQNAAGDAMSLIDMSNGLLLMEQGRYQLKPEQVDLLALMQRVAGEAEHAFEGRHVTVVIDARLAEDQSAECDGEYLLLYSMLHNLVKNAAEASEDNGVVRLNLRQAQRRWLLEVRNAGSVPPAMTSRFFDKFTSHGKSSGTGLGTYSARLIAQAHDATIAVDSTPETGTTVSVHFAPSAAARADLAAERAAAATARRQHEAEVAAAVATAARPADAEEEPTFVKPAKRAPNPWKV
jgi:hypothetical protein